MLPFTFNVAALPCSAVAKLASAPCGGNKVQHAHVGRQAHCSGAPGDVVGAVPAQKAARVCDLQLLRLQTHVHRPTHQQASALTRVAGIGHCLSVLSSPSRNIIAAISDPIRYPESGKQLIRREVTRVHNYEVSSSEV